VRARTHAAALIRLLQQLGCCQRTLGSQGRVVLLLEARHLLDRANYQGDGRQLGLAVGNFIFVERKRLKIFDMVHQVKLKLLNNIL